MEAAMLQYCLFPTHPPQSQKGTLCFKSRQCVCVGWWWWWMQINWLGRKFQPCYWGRAWNYIPQVLSAGSIGTHLSEAYLTYASAMNVWDNGSALSIKYWYTAQRSGFYTWKLAAWFFGGGLIKVLSALANAWWQESDVFRRSGKWGVGWWFNSLLQHPTFHSGHIHSGLSPHTAHDRTYPLSHPW